ncbi:MAG: CDP-diacylglycerol--glycerol-3-phosphate 3-phosphatidyltransferase [Ruminococcaceae bacterium]|nr:CDP-diacylglycerol--glycerol-3-phosphate 3-phosphatidyltransferase [Oscillospiraceae bacterium]
MNMKMNLPNKLTVLRLCLVPVILIVGMLPETVIPFYVSCVLCAVLFIGTSVTDMLDGKIARRDNLITDFGKFLDPVADKFMVIGTLFVILYKFENLRLLMIFTLIIVVFRELAVTSMRLVVSTGEGIVVAANSLGKIKTVSQVVAISTVFLEPVVQLIAEFIVEACKGVSVSWPTNVVPLTWITMIFSLFMTIWSGVNYLKSYWKYLDPEK